jgi:CRISPR/Cas system CMR subunit Cmr6 (Cas7 group RAMP superfamily)
MRASQIRPLAEPKPFFWIPLKYSERMEAPKSHEKFDGLNGYVDLEVKVQSDYLYVGSGMILLNEQNQSYYAFARSNDKLVIPATGMKGPVRSIAEAISSSCPVQIAKQERIVGLKDACTIKKDQEALTKLCPACGLFGTNGYMGRIHFVDAIPVGDLKTKIIKISDLWPPRITRGRKFYQTKSFVPQDNRAERNHRFLEVVPKDSTFVTKLFFENTSPGEMSLLIRSLGIGFPEGFSDNPNPKYLVPIKIGGAKPRCLGAVRFALKGISLLQTSKGAFFSTMVDFKEAYSIIKEWLLDDSLIDEEAWLRFLEGAKPIHKNCPKELY